MKTEIKSLVQWPRRKVGIGMIKESETRGIEVVAERDWSKLTNSDRY
jgi:hypothetical protein